MIKSPSSLFPPGAGDTKRAMIGEPHALPYITSGEIDQEDDTIFASRSSIIFIILSESAAPNHKRKPWWYRPLSYIVAAIIAATTAGAVFAVLGVGYCYHRCNLC